MLELSWTWFSLTLLEKKVKWLFHFVARLAQGKSIGLSIMGSLVQILPEPAKFLQDRRSQTSCLKTTTGVKPKIHVPAIFFFHKTPTFSCQWYWSLFFLSISFRATGILNWSRFSRFGQLWWRKLSNYLIDPSL